MSVLVFVLISQAQARQTSASSRNDFYARSSEGWFWYEVIPPDEDDEQTVPLSPSQPQHQPFTSAWFRAHSEYYLDLAIDNPTPANVRAFLYLQRMMMDKSNRFADVSEQVVLGDPMLDEISRRPLAPFATQVMDREAAHASDEALRALAKTTGIFYFFSADCQQCEAQAGVIHQLQQQYGFDVMPIALDGQSFSPPLFPRVYADDGQAERLGVSTVPALFLVRPPGDITPVGQGTMSVDEIQHRMLLAAWLQGWIDEQTWRQTRPVHPGVPYHLPSPAPRVHPDWYVSPDELFNSMSSQSSLLK